MGRLLRGDAREQICSGCFRMSERRNSQELLEPYADSGVSIDLFR